MTINDIRRIIKEEINLIKESTDIDITLPYGVLEKGGSIGAISSKSISYNGLRLVQTFDTAEKAKDYAKMMRSHLSPGERSYYKMGYSVVKLNPKNIKQH